MTKVFNDTYAASFIVYTLATTTTTISQRLQQQHQLSFSVAEMDVWSSLAVGVDAIRSPRNRFAIFTTSVI